jgi:hypothetical protein
MTPLAAIVGLLAAARCACLRQLRGHRTGSRGGLLPWTLLAVGSIASLAANVAVAQPTVTGRLIAAWPSFTLICSYQLLRSSGLDLQTA